MAGTASSEILSNVGAVLAALSGLATASFGLLDASKAVNGGVSLIGLGHLRTALNPFGAVLTAAVGPSWFDIVRANWINGVPKPDQKTKVGALLKLGLSPETAPVIAAAAHVNANALSDAAAKLDRGENLSESDLNVLGRMTASVEAQLDAAFERAEQQYKNVSRLLAGLVALGLALVAQGLWIKAGGGSNTAASWGMAVAVGLLAVPVAPVAKDLTSALSAAMRALKAAKTF